MAQCPEYEINNLRKTAIVFGEKTYLKEGVLKNPGNDAYDMVHPAPEGA